MRCAVLPYSWRLQWKLVAHFLLFSLVFVFHSISEQGCLIQSARPDRCIVQKQKPSIQTENNFDSSKIQLIIHSINVSYSISRLVMEI